MRNIAESAHRVSEIIGSEKYSISSLRTLFSPAATYFRRIFLCNKAGVLAYMPMLGILSLMLCCTSAKAQLTETPGIKSEQGAVQNFRSNQWAQPYPFSADELQQKLMLVLKIPPNDLSKEKIEAIFNVKFHNSGMFDSSVTNRPDHDKWYIVFSKSGWDWFSDILLARAPGRTYFRFKWWSYDNVPQPYKVPMCLDFHSTLNDIEALSLGWAEPKKYPPATGVFLPSYEFSRRKDEFLRVDYLPGAKCMTALIFNVTTTNEN